MATGDSSSQQPLVPYHGWGGGSAAVRVAVSLPSVLHVWCIGIVCLQPMLRPIIVICGARRAATATVGA
eukprot:14013659-Alexandrium_andersonii.AAC.1